LRLSGDLEREYSMYSCRHSFRLASTKPFHLPFVSQQYSNLYIWKNALCIRGGAFPGAGCSGEGAAAISDELVGLLEELVFEANGAVDAGDECRASVLAVLSGRLAVAGPMKAGGELVFVSPSVGGRSPAIYS
jgi:hypothetical protein